MHGKIVMYMESTGRGTVMNLAKVFYDFNRLSWQHKRSMPSVGVYVEFTADENKKVTSLIPSRFQEFNEADFVLESDFWRTENDDELEDVQNTKRTNYVMQLYRTTDFNQLDHIPLSVTIPQVIQKYFEAEILSVETLKTNMQTLEKEPPVTLNYFIVKKFLTKAFDSLIFMDNTINQRDFSNLKSITMRLEGAYDDMKNRQKNIDTTKIFTENFLNVQCYYLALLSTIDTYQTRMKTCQFQVRSARMDLKYETSKPKPDPEKVQAKQDRIDRLIKEIADYEKNIARLIILKDEFYKSNLETFEKAFMLARQKLFQKIASGLDLCATIMDTRIWSLSLESTGVKNQYFAKHNIHNGFCTLSFAEIHLSRLDKYSLNPNDQRLLSYMQNIFKEHRRKFLIISADDKLITNIKIQIFTQSPYHLVKYAQKKVNFQSIMREETFDLIYIDEETAWDTAADIMLEGKRLDRTGKIKFKTLS